MCVLGEGDREGVKLSLIIPVLASYEGLRRQLLHMERIGLPEDTELIIVDDGSDPPLENTSNLPITIHRTHDTRPWTWAPARNAGAKLAQGEYLLMFDLDHIVTRELLDFVVAQDGPRIHFLRRFGILDESGTLSSDRAALRDYGLTDNRSRIESHHNSFAMKRELFWELGGYREDLIGQPYPQGEDSDFYNKWKSYSEKTGIESTEGPTLYVFPTGRFCGDVDHDEHGLFHSLSRKSKKNYWWNHQRKKECQDLPKT